MHPLLVRQLAADFCVSEADVLDHQHHFSTFTLHPQRRQLMEIRPCLLKIAVVNGKLLFTGREDILARCRALYADADAPWFMEATHLAALNRELAAFGAQIRHMQPFFTAEHPLPVDTRDLTIHRYGQEDIAQFRGDERFGNAYGFCEETPDVLGVAAIKDGCILGMAGASADSPCLWQIGIDVLPQARGQGIATMLVSLLRNDVLRAGRLPYYGTSISHLESQRVALSSGFLPAWFELVAAPVDSSTNHRRS
ncbi:MAG: GNAT family N-acetyltransferase [Clostridiales bacterium]|nr:GNAT family N-acetyltransferase [Clostridiales bacterium]